MEIENQIKKEIASGNLADALVLLGELASASRKDLADEAILLQSRFNQFQKEKDLGLITDNTELAKIQYAVLNALDRKNTESTQPSSKKHIPQKPIKFLQLLGGIFFTFWGLLLISFRIDIVTEWVKGTKRIDFTDLFTPILLLLIGGILLFGSKKRKT
ncbi:MAG: hypothetical protein AAF694_29920 [Bacteroidota bacterium]